VFSFRHNKMSYSDKPNKELYNPDASNKAFTAWSKAEADRERIRSSFSGGRESTPVGVNRKVINPFFGAREHPSNISWRKEPISPEHSPK
jgi:hypothetical protein